MIVTAARNSKHQSPSLRRELVPSTWHNMLMASLNHFHQPAHKSADLKNTRIGHVANYVQFQLMKAEINQRIYIHSSVCCMVLKYTLIPAAVINLVIMFNTKCTNLLYTFNGPILHSVKRSP